MFQSWGESAMMVTIVVVIVLLVILIVLWLARSVRGSSCEICKRPLVNLGRGSSAAESLGMGTMFSSEGLREGLEGPGDECEKCGRIYCSTCAQYDMVCPCGSTAFRTVRLRYR